MQSILTKKQVKTVQKTLKGGSIIKINIRYDDDCNNGYNSFAITGSIYANQKAINKDDPFICGCIHEDIYKYFPEFRHLLKWHLMSSNSPMHYIANSIYHAENEDLDYFKNSAIWYSATLKTIKQDKTVLTKQLEERLPKLIKEFKEVLEKLGFTY